MSWVFKEITPEEHDAEQLNRFSVCREHVVRVALSALLPDIIGVTVENGFVELINLRSGKFRLFLTYLEDGAFPLEASLRCFSLVPCLQAASELGIAERIKRRKGLSESTMRNLSLISSSLSKPISSSSSFGLAHTRGGVETFFLYSIAYSNQILIAEVNSGAVLVLGECESRPSVLTADGDYIMCGEGNGKVSVWNIASILMRSAKDPPQSEANNDNNKDNTNTYDMSNRNSVEGYHCDSRSHPWEGRDSGVQHNVRSSLSKSKGSIVLGNNNLAWLSAALLEYAGSEGRKSSFIWSTSTNVLEGASISGLSRSRDQLFCVSADFRCTILHIDTGITLGKLVQELSPLVGLYPLASREERWWASWDVNNTTSAHLRNSTAAYGTTVIAAYEDHLALYREREVEYLDFPHMEEAQDFAPPVNTMDRPSPPRLTPVPPPREYARVYGYEGGCRVRYPISCLSCGEAYIAAGTPAGVVLLYKCSPAFGIVKELRRFDIGFTVVAIQLVYEGKEKKIENSSPITMKSKTTTSRNGWKKDHEESEKGVKEEEEEPNYCLLVVTGTGDVWRWPLKDLLSPASVKLQASPVRDAREVKRESGEKDVIGQPYPIPKTEDSLCRFTTDERGWCTTAVKNEDPSAPALRVPSKAGTTSRRKGEGEGFLQHQNDDEDESNFEPPSPSTRIPVPSLWHDTHRRVFPFHRSNTFPEGENRAVTQQGRKEEEERKERSRCSLMNRQVPHARERMRSFSSFYPGSSPTRDEGKGRRTTEEWCTLEKGVEEEPQTAYVLWKERLHQTLSGRSSHFQRSSSSSSAVGRRHHRSHSSEHPNTSHRCSEMEQEEGAQERQSEKGHSIPGLRRGTRMDPREVDAVLTNATARKTAEEMSWARKKRSEDAHEEGFPVRSPHFPSSFHSCTYASSGSEAQEGVPLAPPLPIAKPGQLHSTAMQEAGAAALRVNATCLRKGQASNAHLKEVSLPGPSTDAGETIHASVPLPLEACRTSAAATAALPPPVLLNSSLPYRFPIVSTHWSPTATMYKDVPPMAETLAEGRMQQAHPRSYYYLQQRPEAAEEAPVREKKERPVMRDKEEKGSHLDEEGVKGKKEPEKWEQKDHMEDMDAKRSGTSAKESKKKVQFSLTREALAAPVKKSIHPNDGAGTSAATMTSTATNVPHHYDDLQEVTQGVVPRQKDLVYEEERHRRPPNVLYNHGCDMLLYSFPPFGAGEEAPFLLDRSKKAMSTHSEQQPRAFSGREERHFSFFTHHPELILFTEYQLQPTEPEFIPAPLPLPGSFPLF